MKTNLIKGLVVLAISLVGATVVLAEEPVEKGYMGIWLQWDGWEDDYHHVWITFWQGFSPVMNEHSSEYGWRFTGLYYYCDFDDWWECAYDPETYPEPHPGVVLENYREFADCDGSNQQDGWNANDERAAVLLVATHGNVYHEEEDGEYYYTYCFSINEANERRIEPNIDECRIDCAIHYSRRACLRNMRCYDHELIRFGSSSQNGIGDGETRWVILGTCNGLNFQYCPNNDCKDGDPVNVEFSYFIWEIWAHNDLNGGYRLVTGASGVMRSHSKEQGREFAELQLEDHYPMRLAWFNVKNNTIRQNLLGSGPGKCVVMAKGSSKNNVVAKLKLDSLARTGAVEPATPSAADEWWTGVSFKNCEAPKGVGEERVYSRDDGRHKIIVRDPYSETTHEANIYTVVNIEPPTDDELLWFARTIAVLTGAPESELEIYEFNSDETKASIIFNDRWVFTFYYPSYYWSFADLAGIGDMGNIDGKSLIVDTKFASEDEIKTDPSALKVAKDLLRELKNSGLLGDLKQDFQMILVKPIVNLLFDVPDESEDRPSYTMYVDSWFFHFVLVQLDNLPRIGPYGFIEIGVDPTSYRIVWIAKRFRQNTVPVQVITLPSDLGQILYNKAVNDVESKICEEGLPCTVEVDVGYVEESPYKYQYVLEPFAVITYDAFRHNGEEYAGELYFYLKSLLSKKPSKPANKEVPLINGVKR